MAETVALEALAGSPHAKLFDEPLVIRLDLAAGERVDPHRHPERTVVLHLLSGAVALDLDDETHELQPDDVIRFDGRREVSPKAVEDSEALLVLSKRVED
ncbi:Cupin domain-containing protein [Halorientalis persicus]|jgi:quercetin dioxygenase-like cupin family protein|uniref:Cupin domain-containing protein n=1 Tax=Halorientalis persicus TaxID=1367881 RepID=A0A1H8NB54_9EURY|nr:cupin domain-containing protein [Halorientalis persicus]SEO26824.1 Cupin domain-containing protein [Halorientalis persicus]